MVKEKPYLWAKRRAKNLFGYVANWTDDLDIKYEKDGLWSVKKLLAIEWFIGAFQPIARKSFSRWVYVDFFCGSGLMSLTSETFKKKHTSVGSALLPLFLAGQFPFKEYHFYDKEKPNVEALKRRISRISGLTSDSKIIAEALPFEQSSRKLFGSTGSLNKNPLSLVIIDPEGLEVKWNLLANILVNGKVDVILTVMTFALLRNHGIALKDPTGTTADGMTEFFGDQNWKNLKASELVSYLQKKIEDLGYHTERIRVERAGESVLYDILFCTTNDTVFKLFKELKENIRQVTPDMLANAVGSTQKETTDMTDFMT